MPGDSLPEPLGPLPAPSSRVDVRLLPDFASIYEPTGFQLAADKNPTCEDLM